MIYFMIYRMGDICSLLLLVLLLTRAAMPLLGIYKILFCNWPVETYCTLLSFYGVRLNHRCWHCGLLTPFGQYQRKGSVCLLVCFGCACVLVCLLRGK